MSKKAKGCYYVAPCRKGGSSSGSGSSKSYKSKSKESKKSRKGC
jgi:hypothetical protein